MRGSRAERKAKPGALNAPTNIQYGYRCPRCADVMIDFEKTEIGDKSTSTIWRQLDLVRFFSDLYDLSSRWILGRKQNDFAWSLLHNQNFLARARSCRTFTTNLTLIGQSCRIEFR